MNILTCVNFSLDYDDYDCPNCGGVIKYNRATDQYECPDCGYVMDDRYEEFLYIPEEKFDDEMELFDYICCKLEDIGYVAILEYTYSFPYMVNSKNQIFTSDKLGKI